MAMLTVFQIFKLALLWLRNKGVRYPGLPIGCFRKQMPVRAINQSYPVGILVRSRLVKIPYNRCHKRALTSVSGTSIVQARYREYSVACRLSLRSTTFVRSTQGSSLPFRLYQLLVRALLLRGRQMQPLFNLHALPS